jgi:hypothetical protein
MSRKQPVVATSSTEAERIAAHEGALEIAWSRKFLKEIGLDQFKPTVMFIDNMGCIQQATKEGENTRSKHMDIRYHYLKENVQNLSIQPLYIHTHNQLADVMTKPLPTEKFQVFRMLLGVLPPGDSGVSSWSVEGYETRYVIPVGRHDNKQQRE